MPDVLIEIGCEDLPAVACREAERQAAGLVAAAVERLGLPEAEVETHVSPRRIATIVRGLPAARAAVRKEVRGPRAGAPEQARAGFARKHGLDVAALEERDGLVWAVSEGADEPLAALVPQIATALADGINFSKSMRWDGGRFSRPVRWLVAMVDGAAVPVELFGLTATGTTRGHRFLGGPAQIGTPGSYVDDLRNVHVMVDTAERRGLIEAGLNAAGAWIDPLGKLNEVVYLSEWPAVLEGHIDERFLELPDRVVITAMQSHQRYFPVRAGEQLAARFLFVANGGDPTTVIRGNEEVLVGRLNDAEFAFRTDLERGIEAMAGELDRVSFLEGSGSIADKTARVTDLTAQLGSRLGLDAGVLEAAATAARLAKADLVSNLVGEFSSLEGFAGGVYARHAGIDDGAATAIEEHHLPYGATGPQPQTDAGALVSLADKLDTLIVAFGLGLEPTGSRDPYGLRRAAAGAVAILVGRRWTVGVSELLSPAGVEFLLDRVEAVQVDQGISREEVRAARGSGQTEPLAVADRALALHGARGPARDALRDVYGRTHRIAADAAPQYDPDPGADAAEAALHEAVDKVRDGIAAAGTDVPGALAAAGDLVDPVAQFFDRVLVMDENAEVRRNRLGLVALVAATLGGLADFDELPG